MHNICCDNCHSHVARALNIFEYKGKTNYTMVHVWFMLLSQGKYVDMTSVVITWCVPVFFACFMIYMLFL